MTKPGLVVRSERDMQSIANGFKECKANGHNEPSSKHRQEAVCIRNAFKHYGSGKNPEHVINNLNMTVAKGTIYCIIGASGCGKTTLLSCIVGLCSLNSGNVQVLGRKPGSKGSGVPGRLVGYMPQEISLYQPLTIKEMIMYFGFIFGMGQSEILEKIKQLTKFLDLPDKNRVIKTLSGGEQRRVSFAVALVHDPQLLILDEPTVGVDALLRQRIWDHFVEITKDGTKSVIITTHYIEEARQAHKIGMMRDGYLLAEECPGVLMTMYECITLEEVLFKASRKQDDRKEGNFKVATNIEMLPVKNLEALDCNVRSKSFKYNRGGKIKALIYKNIMNIWRNLVFMALIFGVPVSQIVFFYISFGRDFTDLQLAIVNQELKQSTCLPMEQGCNFVDLGCRYLKHLNNNSIKQELYPDPESAIEAVRRGDAWGVVHITDNFTDSLIAHNPHNTEIKVTLDMSNERIGQFLYQSLQASYQELFVEMLTACGQNPKHAVVDFHFREPIYGSMVPNLTNFVAPAIILTIISVLSMSLTSLSLTTERVSGLLNRNWVAGLTTFDLLFSHVVTQFLVMCVQLSLVLTLMILVFGLECRGDIVLAAILVLLQGLCGMCFGFTMAAAFENSANTVQTQCTIFFQFLILCGSVWPVSSMPVLLRYFSKALPLTLAISSLRNIMTRGWGLSVPDVYYGFVSTIIWIIVVLTITVIVLKVKH